jgi:hypothetical protein
MRLIKGIILAIIIAWITLYAVLSTTGSLSIDYDDPSSVQELLTNLNQ